MQKMFFFYFTTINNKHSRKNIDLPLCQRKAQCVLQGESTSTSICVLHNASFLSLNECKFTQHPMVYIAWFNGETKLFNRHRGSILLINADQYCK